MDLESIIGTRDEKLKFENQERTGNGDPVSYLGWPGRPVKDRRPLQRWQVPGP